jgi:hypothetical protein
MPNKHNWVNEILDATSGLEPPRKFFYWSALSALSAVMKRNVYLRKRKDKATAYILYPNIYTFLIGDSAAVRKGVPIKMAKRLVKIVDNTRIITGRSSIQGILKELSTAYTTKTGKIRDTSSCFICASEFRASLVADPQAISILTDLYDGDFTDDWKTTLKGTGVEELKEVYVTMLGGSNPSYLKQSITGADVEGGIIGRSFLVYANERANIEPLTDDTTDVETDEEEEMLDYPKLAKWLEEISKIKGRFRFHPEAKDVYDKWYTDFSGQKTYDKTGTMGRIHDQILKVAMLLSLAKRQTLILEAEDINEAIEESMDLAGNVNRTMMPVGKGEFAEKTAVFLQELLSVPSHEVARHKILQKHWGELDAFDLDRIVETLIQNKAIDVNRNGHGSKSVVTYKLTKSSLDIYLKFQQGGD